MRVWMWESLDSNPATINTLWRRSCDDIVHLCEWRRKYTLVLSHQCCKSEVLQYLHISHQRCSDDHIARGSITMYLHVLLHVLAVQKQIDLCHMMWRHRPPTSTYLQVGLTWTSASPAPPSDLIPAVQWSVCLYARHHTDVLPFLKCLPLVLFVSGWNYADTIMSI